MSKPITAKDRQNFAKAEKLLTKAITSAGSAMKKGRGKRVNGKGLLDTVKSVLEPIVKVARAVPIISATLAATGNPAAAAGARALGLGKKKKK
jgi:hypothetical protein